MGMNVYGRNPSAESGEFFRANVWHWRPIHELICELCFDLLDDGLIEAMAFNDGQGPHDHATCIEIAKRFEAWLADNGDGYTFPSPDIQATEEGRLVFEDELDQFRRENPGVKTRSPYRVSHEGLVEWTEFLKHCGGFEVW